MNEYELVMTSDKREGIRGFFEFLGMGIAIFGPMLVLGSIREPVPIHMIVLAAISCLAIGALGFVPRSEKLVWRKTSTSHPAATKRRKVK